jgi:hypothetical protein
MREWRPSAPIRPVRQTRARSGTRCPPCDSRETQGAAQQRRDSVASASPQRGILRLCEVNIREGQLAPLSLVSNKCLCVRFSICDNLPLPNLPRQPDKGTTVKRGILRVGTIFQCERRRTDTPCRPHPLFPPLLRGERVGKQRQGEQPFAPTPLSHSVGERLGVRAKKRTHSACSEPKRCTLTSPRQRGRNCNSLPVDGESRGGVSNVEISTHRQLIKPRFERP